MRIALVVIGDFDMFGPSLVQIKQMRHWSLIRRSLIRRSLIRIACWPRRSPESASSRLAGGARRSPARQGWGARVFTRRFRRTAIRNFRLC